MPNSNGLGVNSFYVILKYKTMRPKSCRIKFCKTSPR